MKQGDEQEVPPVDAQHAYELLRDGHILVGGAPGNGPVAAFRVGDDGTRLQHVLLVWRAPPPERALVEVSGAVEESINRGARKQGTVCIHSVCLADLDAVPRAQVEELLALAPRHNTGAGG